MKTGSGTQFIDPHLLVTSTLNLRSDPFLRWLRHTGVPLARPGLLLVTSSALLLTTLRFMCVMLVDGVVDSQPGAWHTAESNSIAAMDAFVANPTHRLQFFGSVHVAIFATRQPLA